MKSDFVFLLLFEVNLFLFQVEFQLSLEHFYFKEIIVRFVCRLFVRNNYKFGKGQRRVAKGEDYTCAPTMSDCVTRL